MCLVQRYITIKSPSARSTKMSNKQEDTVMYGNECHSVLCMVRRSSRSKTRLRCRPSGKRRLLRASQQLVVFFRPFPQIHSPDSADLSSSLGGVSHRLVSSFKRISHRSPCSLPPNDLEIHWNAPEKGFLKDIETGRRASFELHYDN
jgi:hypothetical protein